jgi:hypothetical protein
LRVGHRSVDASIANVRWSARRGRRRAHLGARWLRRSRHRWQIAGARTSVSTGPTTHDMHAGRT